MTDQEEVMAYYKLLSGHLSGEGLCKTTEAKYGQSVSWLRIKPATITSQKFEAACLVHFYLVREIKSRMSSMTCCKLDEKK